MGKTAHKNVTCTVDIPEDSAFGEFANSFRLTLDGSEVILDFCVYSETENRAKVVSRVRVSQDFLATIHEKISSSFRQAELNSASLLLTGIPQIDH